MRTPDAVPPVVRLVVLLNHCALFLGAGSDADNDTLLCEVGEACGGYPVLGEFSPIIVDQDVSGLEFVTRYLARVPEPSSAALGIAALATLAYLARKNAN